MNIVSENANFPERLDDQLKPSARFSTSRLAREWKTMAAMITIYCRAQHGCKDTLCAECRHFTDYARTRLERCRFGEEKPTCANCPVHCYQRHHREMAKTIMRYSGPRMLWRHPVLSLIHWLDGFRSAPAVT
ncbi:MAG TPA: nitrous oxide-stimulated promoter family protein [Verrucomicrobiae bacterium]|nr:nitrous oxide-stimulated promoter family protein [Verrucomicrobiae bacterium]